MIPCKDCLILPMCRLKVKQLTCSNLFKWWNRIHRIPSKTSKYEDDHKYEKDMEQLRKYLPEWDVFFWIREG